MVDWGEQFFGASAAANATCGTSTGTVEATFGASGGIAVSTAGAHCLSTEVTVDVAVVACGSAGWGLGWRSWVAGWSCLSLRGSSTFSGSGTAIVASSGVCSTELSSEIYFA